MISYYRKHINLFSSTHQKQFFYTCVLVTQYVALTVTAVSQLFIMLYYLQTPTQSPRVLYSVLLTDNYVVLVFSFCYHPWSAGPTSFSSLWCYPLCGLSPFVSHLRTRPINTSEFLPQCVSITESVVLLAKEDNWLCYRLRWRRSVRWTRESVSVDLWWNKYCDISVKYGYLM